MARKSVLGLDLSHGIVAEELGPSQRRRNALRRRIFIEAGKLFEENGGEEGGGHDKTTAEDIAARSDISVRTFFRYFKSKTDAIYVDVPSAVVDHLALTERWLERAPPAEASLAASVILLTGSLNDETSIAQLRRAMSSKTFVERRSALRAEWREALAALIRPRLKGDEDLQLRSLMIAVSTLDIRETAMEFWHWNDGKIPVIDCFNRVLAFNRDVVSKEIPQEIVIIPSAAEA